MNNDEELNITIRFKGDLPASIRAHVARLQKGSPSGVTVGVTDAIRNLIDRGLKDVARVERDRVRER